MKDNNAEIKPGIYAGIPAEEYHAGPGVSRSGLEKLAKCPAWYKYGQVKQTDAMKTGSLIDCLTLEPHQFHERYDLGPNVDNKNKKEWQEAKKAAFESGKEIVHPSDFEAAQSVADAVRSHPTASKLLNRDDTECQLSGYWIDEETGLLCKFRPDAAIRNIKILIDLKSTAHAGYYPFRKSVADFKYYEQAAFYKDGWKALTGVSPDFVFIAVEKEPPYLVGVYEIDQEGIKQGRKRYKRLLHQLAKCIENDDWPGYSPHLELMTLPEYIDEQDY